MPAVLMTLDDVVADLNLENLDVLRLIARGTLPAQVVGDHAYRILQADVEKVASSNDLTAPDEYGGTKWIDDRPETMRASEFAAGVKTILEDTAPETDPGSDQTIRYSQRVAALGNAAPKPLMAAVFGDRTLPYRNTAELYAVSRTRLHAAQVVNSKAVNTRVQGKRPRSKMETLYASREAYQAIVAEAIAEFTRRSIFVRKSYETGERQFSLPHSSLPIDYGRVEQLAF